MAARAYATKLREGYKDPWPEQVDPRVSHRKHFEDRSKHQTWEYLQGVGPSSSEMYYVEEKKAFKPGWKTLRSQDAINPYQERLQDEVTKVERNDRTSGLRTGRLKNWNQYNNFNPISGNEHKDGAWVPAQDPWSHQRLGLKPVHTQTVQVTKATGRQKAHQDRMERLVFNGGSQQSRATTMRDIFQWDSGAAPS